MPLSYPIYIPSKGRATTGRTAKFLARSDVPFSLVVEPQDYDDYAAEYSEDSIIMLPDSDQGIAYVRNFCKDHASNLGYKRHWQIDDNIKAIHRINKGKRIQAKTEFILQTVEDFTDQYKNIALAGLRATAFIFAQKTPFAINQQVYSCFLVLNELPYRFRKYVIEDSDYNLQVLSNGWCTVLFNAFGFDKANSGAMAGGNTSSEYADNNLSRVKGLQRLWPCVNGIRRGKNKVTAVIDWSWTKRLSKLEKCVE